MPRAAKVLLALCLLLIGTGAGMLLADWVRGSPSGAADQVTTHGEWVTYPNADGDQVRAYVAYPERQGTAPAMIVIHEIFGLTDWEPTVADRFAGNGYVAIAPDLLSARYGSTAAAGDSARRMVSQLTPAEVRRDLDATHAYLEGLDATAPDNVGVIGFCWGGGTVWHYAAHNPALKAAVVCYGPLADTTMLRSVQAPVLGVYGERDGRVNNGLPGIVRLMEAMGKPFTADSYPGTGHGFLKPGRTGSGTPAAARAWTDIDAFLAQHLGS
jgi:carboxymethylenebutenolidase